MNSLRSDVILACPASWPEVSLPFQLGLGYLVAYLTSQGITTKHFVDNTPISVPAVAGALVAQTGRIVGLTCYDSTYYLVRAIARAVKAVRPDLVIVVGGPSTIAESRFILEDCPAVDLCVRGEAELAFYNVARHILDSRDYRDLRALSFRNGSEIVQTPDGDLPVDLTAIPSPYLPPIVPFQQIQRFYLETGRGCPWHCTYCANPGLTSKVRRHSLERIVAEAEAMHTWLTLERKNQPWPVVFINDDDFLQNKTHATEICQALIAKNIRLPLWANCRVEQADKELFRLMAEAGFTELNFGLESATPHVLRAIRKVSPPSSTDNPPYERENQFLATIRLGVADAKAAGIRRVTVSTIIGLPGESRTDAQQTIEFVRSLNVDNYQHNILQIYSGTPLSRTYRRYNLRLEPSAVGLPRQTIHAYDVESIERLPNDAWRTFAVERSERILPVLSGVGFEDRWRGSMLLIESAAPNETVLNALGPWLGSASRVLVLRTPAEPGWLTALDYGLEPGYLWFVDPTVRSVASPPEMTQEFSIFERELIPSHKFINHIYTGAYRFVRIADWGRVNAASMPVGTVRLWWLGDADDAAALALLFPTAADISQYDNVFIDTCRWGAEACPGREARRAIITQNGGVRPCPAAPVVTFLDLGPDSLRIRMEDLTEQVRIKRGCSSCHVDDTCSHCPFPVVLTETYCLTRKEHPDLPARLAQAITPLHVKLSRLVPPDSALIGKR